MFWGVSAVFPVTVHFPAAAFRPLLCLVQPPRPRSFRGRLLTGSRHLGRPFLPDVAGACFSRWEKIARDASVSVVVSAHSPFGSGRKGRVRDLLPVPSGKAANGGPPVPASSPSLRGWPPCFLNTKWRPVARIHRQRKIGVAVKALECSLFRPPLRAGGPGPSPPSGCADHSGIRPRGLSQTSGQILIHFPPPIRNGNANDCKT